MPAQPKPENPLYAGYFHRTKLYDSGRLVAKQGTVVWVEVIDNSWAKAYELNEKDEPKDILFTFKTLEDVEAFITLTEGRRLT